MKFQLKKKNNIAYSCHYHVVFCPKYRRKVLVNGVDERLKTILMETIEKWGKSLWTNSYFVATVGGVTLETLKRYVEGQKNR